MRGRPLLLSLLVALPLIGCDYEEKVAELPATREPASNSPAKAKTSPGPDEEVGDSDVNSSGSDSCGPCTTPPTDECWLSSDPYGSYTATIYAKTGTCGLLETCNYAATDVECPEDCTAGVCHQGEVCSLSSLCGGPLGCKWHSSTELRCKQVDQKREGHACDETRKGFRCAGGLVCLQPSFSTTKVCAELCETHSDCFARGLQKMGQCVKDGALGRFGWCR